MKQALNQHCWHTQNSLAKAGWDQMHGKKELYLVRLSQLVEYTRVNSSSDQIVGCSDGMDVTSEVKVKLEDIKHISYLILLQFSFIPTHRRQMEKSINSNVTVGEGGGGEIAQCSMWKRGKNFSKT